MVASNPILYAPKEHPDHVVVIKYVPYVGDSKRAMDEYTSEIMMGGHNTLVIHNTCEDSLLATPLILDLVILAELCSRIHIQKNVEQQSQQIGLSSNEWIPFRPILSILSYMCKAPLVPEGTQIVNSLFRQRAAIENILRGCIGLPPISHMSLEQRVSKRRRRRRRRDERTAVFFFFFFCLLTYFCWNLSSLNLIPISL